MWTYHGKVRYYETDRMGVVHHSNYLRLLEDARMDWIDENIMTYSDMEKEGIIVPCVHAEGDFIDFLRFDDHYSIDIKLIEYSGVRMWFSYEVKDEKDGRLCYRGKTEHCFTRDGDYKPIPIRRKYPEIHQAMLEQLEGESRGENNGI